MKRIKYWIRNYFGFSKTESNGVLILIPLMFLIIIFPYVHRKYVSSQEPGLTDLKNDELLTQLEEKIEEEKLDNYSKPFKPKYNKRDSYNSKYKSSASKQVEPVDFEKSEKIAKAKFDINLADTSQLRTIYGIGSVLSKRIIKYRQLLGGFASMHQLKEVYGLQDSVINKLGERTYISPDYEPEKIKVNSEKPYIMDDHPYVSKTIANAIDAYRYQHGPFQSIDELQNITILDSPTFNKIYPYLSLE